MSEEAERLNPVDVMANHYVDEAIDRMFAPNPNSGVAASAQVMFGNVPLNNPYPVIEESYPMLELKALKYIEEMALVFDVSTGELDLWAIFKDKSYAGHRILTDKKDINQRFVEYTMGKLANPTELTLHPMLIENLKHQERTFQKKSFILSELGEARSHYKNLLRDTHGCFHKMIDLKQSLFRKENNLISEVQRLPRFFTPDVGASGNSSIMFHTEDCAIKYKRPGDNKNLSMNFGKLRIAVNFRNGQFHVTPIGDNVIYKGFFHPFISTGGTLCFGEQGDLATDLIAKGKWYDYFCLLKTLLTTYNVEAYPYIAIETLWYLGKDKNGAHPWRADSDMVTMQELRESVNQGMEIGCSDCGGEHDTDDCETMTNCSNCEQRYNMDNGHDCPYHECEDCSDMVHEDNDHNCRARCGDCDEQYGHDGSQNHTCPEPEAEETPVEAPVAF